MARSPHHPNGKTENQSVTSVGEPTAGSEDGTPGWFVTIYAMDILITFYE
jgi:hypothetical protein